MSDVANASAFSVEGKSAIVTGAGSGKSDLTTSKDYNAEGHHRNQLLLRQTPTGKELQRRNRRSCFTSGGAEARR
jgi:hypothetical protein